jgi:hypothetical protein
MLKRKMCITSGKTMQQKKKARDSFKLEWLKVKVTTDTPESKNVSVDLGSI